MFNGLWFKFGDYEIPKKYMIRGSYDTAPSQVQDIDSFTDGDGVTNRNALEHTKSQVQFRLMKMPEKLMIPIIDGIKRNFLNPLERDGNCTYYDMWEHGYKTVHMYIDPSTKFVLVEEIPSGELIIEETQMLFIEY